VLKWPPALSPTGLPTVTSQLENRIERSPDRAIRGAAKEKTVARMKPGTVAFVQQLGKFTVRTSNGSKTAVEGKTGSGG